MKSPTAPFRLFLLLAVLASAPALYPVIRGAQTPSLAGRIARLKAEINSVPTDANNYTERIRTLRDWGDDLTAHGRSLTQQDLNLTLALLSDPTPQADAAVRRWVKALSFLEEKGDQLGTLVRTDKNELTAGQYATVVLEYIVGEAEIPKGEGIRVGQNLFSNRPRLQTVDPEAESYVSFKVESRTATTEPYPAYWQSIYADIFGPAPMPGLRVTAGALKTGDKVTVTIGDTRQGSPGYRPSTRDADDFRFLVAADFDGQGTIIPAATVSTKISGDAAALINAVVPSVVDIGEAFAVRVRVEDQYWNPARFEGGAFKVSLNGRLVGEVNIPAGQYVGRLDGVKIAQEGGYKFDVISADGRFACRSNPVLVERNPQQRIYWGELHGHSGWEEATGSVPRYYEFARDVAFLDFGSLTGHELFLSTPGWDEIRRETEKANRDGQFVAFMGYERTQHFTRRGYRVGFIAAGDDHTGHPGYSPAIISTRNGLAAVYAPKLDRDSIWRGMKERATYATSNATRLVVRMSAGDKRVGEAVPADSISGSGPTIKARVLGAAAIDHIDVIHNGAVRYSRDYLSPRPGDPAAVQIMFHSPTETPGDEVTPPKGGVGWGGWIEVTGGRIAGIEPLNVDHFSDEFHQVDDRRIWFTCRTRGDFDGLLIRLSQAPADTLVKVIVSELTATAGGTESSGYVSRPPGPPNRNKLHEANFKVSDVGQKKAEFKLTPYAYVSARKVKADAGWDVSFSYRPTNRAAQDDYYYLRVVQIDGEAAWVSPIWIGEQTSPRKK